MNYNILCNRIMCCLKLRFSNIFRTYWTKHGTQNASQLSSILFNFPKEMHISAKKFNDESLEESGETEDLTTSFSKNLMIEDYSEQFRNTLYPDSLDPLISQFKSCGSIKELFSIINENKLSLNSSHCCQVLLVLYDILNGNNDVGLFNGKSLITLPKNLETELSVEVMDMILNMLDILKNDLVKLTPEELVCCVLYSKRMGVDFKSPYIQVFLTKIDSLLSNQNAESFPISALSRLTIMLTNQSELWTKIFLMKTLPFIYTHFDRCQSIEDYRALTISMLSTVNYLREELFLEYEALTDKFVRKGLLTRDHQSVIVKAVMLFNHMYHKPFARNMKYKLLHMLHGSLDRMFLPHLLEIHKTTLLQIEPRDTMLELYNLNKKTLLTPSADDPIFSYYIPLMHLPKNAKGTQIMKEFIAKSDDMDRLLTAQDHLTTAMPDVCHLFWSKMANLVKLLAPGDLQSLIRVCFRYMGFSFRMAVYHHKEFELAALTIIARELVAGTTAVQPRELAYLASFVFAMDPSKGAASLTRDVMMRLMPAVGQLDEHSCLWLSRGLGERLHRSKKVHDLLQIDSALNERTRELIDTGDPISIMKFNSILRSCINRKQSMESDIIQNLMKRLEFLDWSQLTSRSLRNLVYNLHTTSALVPPVIDHMVDYCLINSNYVMASTLGKLLYLCYHLGYSPRHIDSFCSLTANLATRDQCLINGLNLLQLCLALSFFNHMPTSLIRVVFTVEFLERLDNEIKHCFSKDKYPIRVRQTLMELNRSVCLDLPEADVPWFHTKFCEEQKAIGQLEVVPKSLLFTDVYNTMLKLVSDPQYIETRAFTPYGYSLDIGLNLDTSLRPVSFKNKDKISQRVAVLLYYGDSYTAIEQRLKGYHQMKQRHLEILGYRVIGLSDSLWNAMYMSDPKVKLEYLQNLVWPS